MNCCWGNREKRLLQYKLTPVKDCKDMETLVMLTAGIMVLALILSHISMMK